MIPTPEAVACDICEAAQQASLEAWAGYSGRGQITSVLLFRYRDQPLCRPLRMDRPCNVKRCPAEQEMA